MPQGHPDLPAAGVSDGVWPSLPLKEWEDTRDTLHMWTQIVGKVRLALMPMVNHWWQVTLYVTTRGLATSAMPYGSRALEIEFDFLRHVLELRTSDGGHREVRLEPRSVADFYTETMTRLEELEMPVRIFPRPVEVPVAIPFPDDEEHTSYDGEWVRRFWRAMLQASRVLTRFRGRWTGKVSPVHFFWGGFDLAVTRFSGRVAPPHPGGMPNCPTWVMRLAYSHEVSSCGYWPGGAEEGAFYAYGYPTPAGFAEWPVQPAQAHYDPGLDEFILPYEAVRAAAEPDAALLGFVQSAYEAVAIPAGWDRQALEADQVTRSL